MYRIDRATNNIIKLEERRFGELKIREREHLQEWIAKNPEILGEDLLIIQKEYDGFNDTRERLDLLALDKNGGLVVIENKLDDTGRDVVWQAIKYASYCSTLSTKQVFRIYQEYLDKIGVAEDAMENVLEFLGRDENELLLNDEDQRIIFVANEYRKEVTSTVLWLLQHDLQIQCFRALPYSMGEELFLQVEQIIPLPETHQFIIDAKEKAKEEKEVSKTVAESEARLVRFWSILKKTLTEKKCSYLDNVSAKPYWEIGFGKGIARFAYCIGKKTYRVELYFAGDTDKKYIDAMLQYKEVMESKCSKPLVFERLEGKKASRIKMEENGDRFPNSLQFKDEVNWQELTDWYAESMIEFYKAVYPIWEKVQRELS